MKPEEAIKTIKIALAEVEWNYPMDYTGAFEEAIMALEKQMQTCEDCLHAGPLQISHNTVFCFEHSCAMSCDNCCRDWIRRLSERR